MLFEDPHHVADQVEAYVAVSQACLLTLTSLQLTNFVLRLLLRNSAGRRVLMKVLLKAAANRTLRYELLQLRHMCTLYLGKPQGVYDYSYG